MIVTDAIESRLRVGFKHAHQVLGERAKDSECLLLISVGQEAHEGRHFELTIELINKSFSRCTILLGDSIQRYTMALAKDAKPENHYQDALSAGNDWLQRNSRSLLNLRLPYKILRWDQWLFHPDFSRAKMAIESAFKEDEQYYKSFVETADAYLNRYKKQRGIEYFDGSKAYSICLEYLIEECAIFCLWPELKCEFELYPNAHNSAIEATRRKFLIPAFPNLLHSVSLRFRHANLFKPLQFAS